MALEARYFRNFADISEAVGLNSPTVLHYYGDDLVTLSGYERFNCPEDGVYRNRLKEDALRHSYGRAINFTIVNLPGRAYIFLVPRII